MLGPAMDARDHIRRRGQLKQRHAVFAQQPVRISGRVGDVMREASGPPAFQARAQSLSRAGPVIGRRPEAVDINNEVEAIGRFARLVMHILIVVVVALDLGADDQRALDAATVHGVAQLFKRAARRRVGRWRLIRPAGPGVAMRVNDHGCSSLQGSSGTKVIWTCGPRHWRISLVARVRIVSALIDNLATEFTESKRVRRVGD